jgi:hypothetical protein
MKGYGVTVGESPLEKTLKREESSEPRLRGLARPAHSLEMLG